MAYTENDSFCTLSGVQAYAQYGSYTSGTNPTQSQVLDFMAAVAGDLQLLMASHGLNYTVPAGEHPVNSDNTALARVLGDANAVGAAIRAVTAKEVGIAPSTSEKVQNLAGIYQELYQRLDEKILPKVAATSNQNTLTKSHLQAGCTHTYPRNNGKVSAGWSWSMNKKAW